MPAVGYDLEALLGCTYRETPGRAFSWPHGCQSRRLAAAVLRKFVVAFLAGPGLPFAEILCVERIERIFARHGGPFAASRPRGRIAKSERRRWDTIGFAPRRPAQRCCTASSRAKSVSPVLVGMSCRHGCNCRAGASRPRSSRVTYTRCSKQIADREVANLPGRVEPRVLKRRRHGDKLMQKPRRQLRRELHKRCT